MYVFLGNPALSRKRQQPFRFLLWFSDLFLYFMTKNTYFRSKKKENIETNHDTTNISFFKW